MRKRNIVSRMIAKRKIRFFLITRVSWFNMTAPLAFSNFLTSVNSSTKKTVLYLRTHSYLTTKALNCRTKSLKNNSPLLY
jgi:hypothetical protein